MKVLMLLTNPFRPDPRVYEEAKVLLKEGYDVTILCWNRGEDYPQREVIDGINVERISVPSSYGIPGDFLKGIFLFYLKAMEKVRREKFDIIHANDFDTLPLAIILKKLHRWKVVYDAHDHYSSMIEDVMPYPIPRFVRKLEKSLIKYTDARIAATEDLGKLIFGTLPFETIMNAKNLKDYDIENSKIQEFRKKINPEEKFLIVYIGILKLWTPLPHIIKAVKNMPEVLLLVGGKGPHKAQILDMIKGASNISYLGWVHKREVPLYTLSSDLIVLPSNPNKEYTRVAVANKLMEALAAGKPIIAGENTAGGRIVKECKCGLICRFGDIECLREKIKYVRENEKERNIFGKNARRCAEKKYNWEVMSRRLLNLYSNL